MTDAGRDRGAEETAGGDAAPLTLTRWRVAVGHEAAFAMDLPATASCAAPLPVVEDGLVEFDTFRCAARTVVHPLGVVAEAGCVLSVIASHTILTAPTPATGRMRVALDGRLVLDWEEAIPGPANLATARVEVDERVEAEALLGVHVSNHGANNWRLVSVTVSGCHGDDPAP